MVALQKQTDIYHDPKKFPFHKNPANTSSPDFKGPVPYPRMLYRKEAVTQLNQHGDPYEFERVAEVIVPDEAGHKAALAVGWHEHPQLAMKAEAFRPGVKKPALVPPTKPAG